MTDATTEAAPVASDAMLDAIVQRLRTMPKEQRAQLEAAYKAEKALPWRPDPTNKPQQAAFACNADLLLYGGAAGGGKTDLLLGLALTAHRQSVIFRRAYVDLRGIEDRLVEIIGGRDGYNAADKVLRYKGKVIEFGALEKPGAELGWQGRPHDLIGFDEGAQLAEAKVRFVLGWLRTTTKGQRCRAVIASNPPMGAEGDWLRVWFGPWIDDRFPHPAKPGELRWCCTKRDGTFAWVDGPGEHEIDGETLLALSRTYIPARLSDNKHLSDAYRAQIMSQPEPWRSKLLHGDFLAGREDDAYQVIPSRWVDMAMERWTPDGWRSHLMTAMAIDAAGGGSDAQVICWRHGGWYALFVVEKGPSTADANLSAALIFRHRKDNAPVVIDMGGGYGFSVQRVMKDNGLPSAGFNGAAASTAHAKGGGAGFVNKRAEAWWRMREELDPDQPGGSAICLPPDPELKADLTAARFEMTPRGLKVEAKDDIRERLGRSPDRGDAAVMCLAEGNAAVRRTMAINAGTLPKVVMGHSAVKRRH